MILETKYASGKNTARTKDPLINSRKQIANTDI
jgi:hypothetical protein